MNKITFHWLAPNPRFGIYRQLKPFIARLFSLEKTKLQQLTYIFCTDEYLLALNQNHLNHNTLTDIITFDLSETNATTGEIYISLPRLKENAAKYGVSHQHEFLRVVFHGALHLCGYKDKRPADKTIMTQKEDFYLNLFVSRETK
jgi:probable rRNA maturation factor